MGMEVIGTLDEASKCCCCDSDGARLGHLLKDGRLQGLSPAPFPLTGDISFLFSPQYRGAPGAQMGRTHSGCLRLDAARCKVSLSSA